MRMKRVTKVINSFSFQNLFYTFVRTGSLPQSKDVTQGMYVVDGDIETRNSYTNCQLWKSVDGIVPEFAKAD